MAGQPGKVELRREAGRALRQQVSRKLHEETGNVQRDPVDLLAATSKGRVARLVPLRYGRMLASPFAFYRGSAVLQAHDLAGTPHTGLFQQICGDAHLSNFGGFATPERNVVFDLNDFDETVVGPWEWDLKRLAASFAVAGRQIGIKATGIDDAVRIVVQSYCARMAECAEMGALELWYDKLTFEAMQKIARTEEVREAVKRSLDKALERTHGNLLPKIGSKHGDTWAMHDTPPSLFHVHGANTLFDAKDDWSKLGSWKKLHKALFGHYLESLSPSHRQLLGYFQAQDLAFKVVGVGSVGTRCLVLLMTDAQDQPLFLQIKEAGESVLAPYVPAGGSPFAHAGQRVVAGQRIMQSISDLFLGWSTGPSGRPFYFRQLRDMKVSFEVETLNEDLLGRYGRLCGAILARAHARAGGMAPEISGYLGKGDRFGDVMVAYARGYADQVERDFDRFRKACQSGRLTAMTDADFEGSFRL